MKEKLDQISQELYKKIGDCDSTKELEKIRVDFLGKKGSLKQLLNSMKDVDPSQRPVLGKIANEIRDRAEELIVSKKKELFDLEIQKQMESEYIDITLPGNKSALGSQHPMTKTINEIIDVFIQMGFTPFEGPEIESVYNNFDALNAPKNHPSRGISDTFYIDQNRVLRTHTSPVQIRMMKKLQPPIRMISVGRCFRNDEFDATHSPMFYQMEGLVISEDATMAELKGVLENFVLKLFGSEIKSVFRPHNFPFTEPSAEVDISCFKCNGEGCKFCGHSGFIEILGCGMVHPNVLKECGIDPERYKGFAFGMGLDRITMLKYEIDDIRLLYENDKRFISQFRR